ncbi:MAG: DNA topoisomerase IB [Pseudomonadota bacterium]
MYLSETDERLAGAARERCEALAIPPAWSNVWISPDADAHLLALGEDDAGRRQYIYHPEWRAACERAKFADLTLFAERLPRLRRQVKRMLNSDEHDTLALATVIRLLDRAGLRIGKLRGDASDPAIGATTLSPEHCEIGTTAISLEFTAKAGRNRTVEVQDERLAKALGALVDETEDDELIFETETGRCSAKKVNAFLEDTMGAPFSAKDFRTWGGSVAAAKVLRDTQTTTISDLAQAAADWLGNTPAIARASYIHPTLVELARADGRSVELAGPTRLRVDERYCYGAIASFD